MSVSILGPGAAGDPANPGLSQREFDELTAAAVEADVEAPKKGGK